MAMEIGFVSCTKQKLGKPAVPRELYQPSAYFRKASAYAELEHDDWYILSAKHHVLDPDGSPIAPYDDTLSGATVSRKREWSQIVFKELEQRGVLNPDNTLVFHTGQDYYQELIPLLQHRVAATELATAGLRYGETLAWYNEQLQDEPKV